MNTAYTAVTEDYHSSVTRVLTLTTSYDPDRYAVLTAAENVIFAQGYFKDMQAADFYISASNMKNIESSFKLNPDGSFSAYFGGVPTVNYARVVIKFADGSDLMYRAEYTNGFGWYFADNGLSAKMNDYTENYFTATPEVNALYVSAKLNPEETADTLNKLYEIAQEVTTGISDDYQKAKLLNSWVGENIYYDRDASENEVTEETVSLKQTLELKRSVCIGIANIYGALLEAVGIKAVNIKGVSGDASVFFKGGGHHEWVAFWYEKENRWVYTDPTWDRKSIYENGEYKYLKPSLKHFDISPVAMAVDRRGDRAELRNYFSAPDYINIINAENPALEEEHENPAPKIPETSVNNTIPQIPVNTTIPINSTTIITHIQVNNNVLYALIGVMTLLAGVLIGVIIKLRK